MGAGEQGSATVEAVIVVPALMLAILLALQVALWALAAEAVQQVAEHAAVAASGLGGTPAVGASAARSDLRGLAGRVVVDPTVAVVQVGSGAVEVKVSARVETILPWLRPSVRAARTATVQQFRASP